YTHTYQISPYTTLVRSIHMFYQPLINRIILHLSDRQKVSHFKTSFSDPHGIGLIAVFFPLFPGGLNRGVNGVKGQISKKGSVFIGLNKRASFFSWLFWMIHPLSVGM